MVFEHVIGRHGVRGNITTDCSKEFTSRFWDSDCSHLSINHRLLTAFHLQTDSQTESQNQMMEQYLGALCNNNQDNWDELLPLTEVLYNNTIHHSTLMTPFWANYNYCPTMQFKPPKDPRFRSQVQADSGITGMEETHEIFREIIIQAPEGQTKYAGRKEMTFGVGDKVWLSTRNLKTSRLSKKLDYKPTGPYTLSTVINTNAYKLDFPSTIRNHKIFHLLVLDHYTPPVTGQLSSEPHKEIID